MISTAWAADAHGGGGLFSDPAFWVGVAFVLFLAVAGKTIVKGLTKVLDDRTALFDALSQFVHKRFDILLLQVLDADELNLPARSVAKFVDAETRETVEVDADEIRAAYQRRMRDEINALAREADLLQIQHRLCDTANPYIDAIEAYMGFRGKQP